MGASLYLKAQIVDAGEGRHDCLEYSGAGQRAEDFARGPF